MENNTLLIKSIGVAISTFETLPLQSAAGRLHLCHPDLGRCLRHGAGLHRQRVLLPPHGDTTMGEYYAVYQSGAELLGVGLTSTEALQDAERWRDRTLSPLTSYGLDGPRGETRGAYYLRPCTPELYAAVQAGGRSIPYAVNDEGYLAVLDPREA
jgi:hypothetical protein